MLLILTNSQDATADYLEQRTIKAGLNHIRLNTDIVLADATFSYDRQGPVLRIDRQTFAPREITTVWYRRPESLKLPGANETPDSKYVIDEWAEAIEGFLGHIPSARWINHPAADTAASSKIVQLTTAATLGFRIPDTIVTQDSVQLKQFYKKHDGHIIVKPMSAGYVTGHENKPDSLIYTNDVDADHLDNLDDLQHCPTLFQERIHKMMDVRITVVDTKLHAIALYANGSDGQQRCDIRRNNMEDVDYRPISLPDAIEQAVFSLLQHYGLRFGAIDMAVTKDGQWIFFEINPNGQWAWLDIAGVSDIGASFLRSFHSAAST